MEDIIKFFTDSGEATQFWQKHGFEWLAANWKWLVDSNILFWGWGVLLAILGGIGKFIIWTYNYIQQQRLVRDLHPYYTPQEIQKATRYYIPTQSQNKAPSEKEELYDVDAVTIKTNTLKFFLTKAFRLGKDPNRFYLVLADSGMGKTTFMINLYLRYALSWKAKLMFWRRRFRIKLFPLGDPDVLEEIANVEQPENTILLLDAFDEDNEAIKDHETRLKTILEAVKKFREVVITCRTQFFASEAETPSETHIRKHGVDRGYLNFGRIYISPFSDDEVRKYLWKKYGLLKWSKRNKALAIVDNSKLLMVRPMLLSYIDDLLESGKKYVFKYQIYETLIEKWINREANRLQEKDQPKFKENLYKFSEEVALKIYDHVTAEKPWSLQETEVTKVAASNFIELAELEMKSRSLLNRDAVGNYKFSHKSIFEYFIAVNGQIEIGDHGMDMAQLFRSEFVSPKMIWVDGGKMMVSKVQPEQIIEVPGFFLSQTPLTVGHYRKYCQMSGNKFPDLEPGWGWHDKHPMINVSWHDAKRYCKWLSEKTGENWRLPSEIEWEFAARGGRNSNDYEYAGSNEIEEVAWFAGNSNYQAQPVAQLKANELGLYDMSGNVWEWCEDLFEKGGSERVIRGGSWGDAPEYCRPSYRRRWHPELSYDIVGFRLAFSR